MGRLFKDIECKTIHPESRTDLPFGEKGLLCFKGPNIFSGYLNEEKKTKQVLTDDGWFITGDLGYVNKEGFLFIEGRLSRFSKIEKWSLTAQLRTNQKVFATKLKEESQLAILGKTR